MSLGDILFLVIAGVLALAAFRGLKAGRFGFTHDPQLASDRTRSPLWFWGQLALIICTIAVLVWAALL